MTAIPFVGVVTDVMVSGSLSPSSSFARTSISTAVFKSVLAESSVAIGAYGGPGSSNKIARPELKAASSKEYCNP